MFCTQCGAVITNEQAMFCPQCGSPTKRADSVQPSYKGPEEAPPIEEPHPSYDESTTVLTADQMPYPNMLHQPDGRPNMAASDSPAEMGMGAVDHPQGSRPATLNQRSAVSGGSENNTEILDSPYVMNNTIQPGTGSGTGERKSGALKWILIGGGAFLVVLIVVIGILIAVMLPKAGDTDGELAGKDEQQEVTPEELDDIISSVDSQTSEITETEAPVILVSSISISGTVPYLMVGSNMTPAVVVEPADASDLGLIWTSDQPEIAAVDASGTVTGMATGNTVIRCSSADGSGAAAQYEIMVVSSPSEAFTAHLYANCLGRNASADELRSWAGRIDSGEVTPGQAAKSFCMSQELNLTDFSDEDYIKIMYRTFMNREYDQAGMDHWLELIGQGTTREELLQRFADSDEFQSFVTSLGLNPAPAESAE